jgi:hypothetical protein
VTPARSGIVVHRAVPAHLACGIGARAQAGERDAWPAVVAIALGTFALVFSELIPVGLLSDISGHLHVSVGTGGLMVVVPAVAAALAAPLLSRAGASISSPPGGSVNPGLRAGPGSAGAAARRDRQSRNSATNTPKLPFAAIPRPPPGRNCYAQRDRDDRIRTA